MAHNKATLLQGPAFRWKAIAAAGHIGPEDHHLHCELVMNSNMHSGYPDSEYKPDSFIARLFQWARDRFEDVMVAAAVLHDIRWAAPWDEPRRRKAASR